MNEREVRYLLNAFMGMNGITDEDMEKAGYYTAERVGELQAKEADHLLAATREHDIHDLRLHVESFCDSPLCDQLLRDVEQS